MAVRRSTRFCAATLALLVAGVAVAAEPLDFELPKLDGREFFRLSSIRGGSVLINFWDAECPPCAREMPMLDQFARSHHEVLMVGVSLEPRAQTRDFLEGHPVGYLQLLGPSDPRGLLRRFGDPAGALPHTVVLREDHSLCETHTGEVSRKWLDAALQHCRSSRTDGATARQ